MRVSVCPQSRNLISWLIFMKVAWRLKHKKWKRVGPPPIMPQKLREQAFCSQICKTVKSQYFSYIRLDHYANGREDKACQGDVVGGLKWENNNPQIQKQVYLSHFCTKFCSEYILWSADCKHLQQWQLWLKELCRGTCPTKSGWNSPQSIQKYTVMHTL